MNDTVMSNQCQGPIDPCEQTSPLGRPDTDRSSGSNRPSARLHIVRNRYSWTLFGPYAQDRQGPLRTGPPPTFNSLGSCKPAEGPCNQLEGLAGAISWGFDVSFSAPFSPCSVI